MDLQSQFIYKQTIINLQKFTSTYKKPTYYHIITEMNDNINIYSFINQDYKLHGIWLYRRNINDKGSSWPWSHGSCIYNYQCNLCLSPLMLWVRISIMWRYTTLCNNVCHLVTCDRSVIFSRSSDFLYQ